jgi:hypothetical protein
MSSIPEARAASERLEVLTNLNTFAATVPSYLGGNVVGPAVVPCYVGWYFANILANGSVMPCCQCARPQGVVTRDVRVADIWRSPAYDVFRRAARRLPEESPALSDCECHRCMLRPRNVSLHNMLHPWNRIEIERRISCLSSAIWYSSRNPWNEDPEVTETVGSVEISRTNSSWPSRPESPGPGVDRASEDARGFVIVTNYNARERLRACSESVACASRLLPAGNHRGGRCFADGSADMVRAEWPAAVLLRTVAIADTGVSNLAPNEREADSCTAQQ